MIKKMKNTFFALSSALLLLPMMVSAAGDYGIGTNQGAGGSATNVADIIEKIIKFLLGFVGGLSVLMIIVAGIMYITSGGDEARVDTAKKWLTYSIVGLVVALLGWVIVKTVISGLG